MPSPGSRSAQAAVRVPRSKLVGERVGVDDSGPAVERVGGFSIRRVVDRRERTTGGAGSVGRRELGRHDQARRRPAADLAGRHTDRGICQFVLACGRSGRRRRDPPAGAPVHLTGRAVAGLRVRVASLRQGVRAGGDRLRPKRVRPGSATGQTPARRRLPRHDAAQVRLDQHRVDGAVLADSAVGRVDAAAVVIDDPTGLADAEQVAGCGGRVVTAGRRERDGRSPRPRGSNRIDLRPLGWERLGLRAAGISASPIPRPRRCCPTSRATSDL